MSHNYRRKRRNILQGWQNYMCLKMHYYFLFSTLKIKTEQQLIKKYIKYIAYIVQSLLYPMDRKQNFEQQIIQLEQKYEQMKQSLMEKKKHTQLSLQEVEELTNLMNMIGMKYSQNGQHQTGEQWLKRSLKHAQHSQKLKLITYNNLACVYRESNNLPLALLYINKAQKQSQKLTQYSTPGAVTDCSLNICAILSSMNQHKKALNVARNALQSLQEAKEKELIPSAYYNALFPVLKYNEAVQLQNLRKFPEALKCYESAKEVTGIDENLLQKIEQGQKSIKKMKKKRVIRYCRSENKRSLSKCQETVPLKANFSRLNKFPEVNQNQKPGLKLKQFRHASTKKLKQDEQNIASFKLVSKTRQLFRF